MSLFSKKEPETVDVHGRPLTCRICGHDRFWRREGQLNTAVASFFSLDWANPQAICMVCEQCGYVHWFLPKS